MNDISVKSLYNEQEVTAMRHSVEDMKVPTFEAPGKEYGVTHPDVIRFHKPWNGYTYWMGITPNQNGNSQFENPCIVASNDGKTWEVPAGITNPLTGVPEEPIPYHNCDVDIVYNEAEDAIFLYYVWTKDKPQYGEDGFMPSEVRMFEIRHNGSSFMATGPKTVAKTKKRYDLFSPAVVISPDGTWMMWSVSTGDTGWNNQSNIVELRTSKDGYEWTEPKSLENTFIQNGYLPWHLDVKYIPSKNKYVCILSAYPAGGDSRHTDLFLATSDDGITWKTYSKPILSTKKGSWDDDFIYRSSFCYDEKTDVFSLWYSAGLSKGWLLGYTENTYENILENIK